MADTDKALDPRATIYETINSLLERREAGGVEITPESKLDDDLGLDSLELAELSAALEDELGSDPFSEGTVPETVAELLAFYDA